jgi:hypothetical protein
MPATGSRKSRRKRAPFYSLAPGLGKRAALALAVRGCGEPAAI